MGRKGSMNLQVITESFVKDPSRRRNNQLLSARLRSAPVKASMNNYAQQNLTILTATPNNANNNILNSPIKEINTNNSNQPPKTPTNTTKKGLNNKLSAPTLKITTPSSAIISDVDIPDTPSYVIYAQAFFENKVREDEENDAKNRKLMKQKRKQKIRSMRRERMKQPKDVRVALILGRLYDASHYELGPLSYWSEESNDDQKDQIQENKNKTKETQQKPKINENDKNLENNEKVNINYHPSWVPEDAGNSEFATIKTASYINNKLVKKNRKPYMAIASYYAKLYDPLEMKKREEEEAIRLLERKNQNSIIRELKPFAQLSTKNGNSSNFNSNRSNNSNYYNNQTQNNQSQSSQTQYYKNNMNTNNYNVGGNNKIRQFNYRTNGNENQLNGNQLNGNKTNNSTYTTNNNKSFNFKGNNEYDKKYNPNRKVQQNNYVTSVKNNDYYVYPQEYNYMYNSTPDYGNYEYSYVYQYPIYQYGDSNMDGYYYTNYDNNMEYNNSNLYYGYDYSENDNNGNTYNKNYSNYKKGYQPKYYQRPNRNIQMQNNTRYKKTNVTLS